MVRTPHICGSRTGYMRFLHGIYMVHTPHISRSGTIYIPLMHYITAYYDKIVDNTQSESRSYPHSTLTLTLTYSNADE